MSKDQLVQIQDFLTNEFKEFEVVTMPDFFFDRLISPGRDLRTFCEGLQDVAKKKGGSIDNILQTDIRGGNAINTASALASLGAKVTPIVCTNAFGSQSIRFYLKSQNVNLSHVKVLDKPSITTAIELDVKDGKTNIMLRDIGSLSDFGPQQLNDDDFEMISNADYVCVFNWAGTRQYGSRLAKEVFHYTKTKGGGKTYYDTADPSPEKERIPILVSSVLRSADLDILSVNENEAISYATQISDEVGENRNRLNSEKLAIESAKILASSLSARVDLHTTSFSGTFIRKKETIVPALHVRALRATGAGDAWNAGNIVGDAHKLSDECRLTLANAVAAYYVSHPDGKHPSPEELSEFCYKIASR